jgi:replication factor C subunit 3/5
MNPTNHSSYIPWIEKYRPSQFDDIVLDPLNKELFQNILQTNYFPNLLFYGPPGTGKTTTIINLINEYQTIYHNKNKSTVIHLNASDERGIDIIRNQINQFVKSMNLFEKGLKFVILDEVDYMTKNAQQALKHLLQSYTSNVRFCLICNYITKIDESLKNEFICIRFNQLQKKHIYQFIQTISMKENMQLTDETIEIIQTMFHSDIRSMINFLQLNQNLNTQEWKENIMNISVLETFHSHLLNPTCDKKYMLEFLHSTSIKYNTDKNTILQKYLNYIIRNYPQYVIPPFLHMVQVVLHNHKTQNNFEERFNYFYFHCREIYHTIVV